MNIPFIGSVNFTPGRSAPCRLIVLHYTAMGGFDEALRLLVEPHDRRVSAHFLVDRAPGNPLAPEGVAQLVRLEDTAHHAGLSSWQGVEGVNAFSVGVEICNYGWLTQEGGGYATWDGTPYPHELGEPIEGRGRHWEPFKAFQVERVARLCRMIRERLPQVEDIVGHEDISPGRKEDPGPAWDWERFRDLVRGGSVG